MITSETSANLRFRRCADVRFRIIDGEAVVLRQGAGENLVLNEVGSRILELVDGGKSLAQVTEELLAELEVTADELGRDLLPFLRELQAAGVIEPLNETHAGGGST